MKLTKKQLAKYLTHAREAVLEYAIEDDEPIRMVRGTVKIGETGYHDYYYRQKRIEPTTALGPHEPFRVRAGNSGAPHFRSRFKYFGSLKKAKAWIDAQKAD
jgi:hypothetical protein